MRPRGDRQRVPDEHLVEADEPMADGHSCDDQCQDKNSPGVLPHTSRLDACQTATIAVYTNALTPSYREAILTRCEQSLHQATSPPGRRRCPVCRRQDCRPGVGGRATCGQHRGMISACSRNPMIFLIRSRLSWREMKPAPCRQSCHDAEARSPSHHEARRRKALQRHTALGSAQRRVLAKQAAWIMSAAHRRSSRGSMRTGRPRGAHRDPARWRPPVWSAP